MSGERLIADDVRAVLAAWKDAARHHFAKRSGYGDGSKKYDDCFRCRGSEQDELHDYAGPEYTDLNNNYLILDLATIAVDTAEQLAHLAVQAARTDGVDHGEG